MIVIIDYGLGNLASVKNMFRKSGIKDVVISRDEVAVAEASKIILPGVGAFDAGMNRLQETGLIPLLNKKALEEKVPVLGICLGMQMLGRGSEEGSKAGLGWIDAQSMRFRPTAGSDLKVPHMGWDYIRVCRPNPLVPENTDARFYFVHSYYVQCDDPLQVLATCHFGIDFTCMVNKENIYGTQFHPEKSLRFGMDLLKNFAEI